MCVGLRVFGLYVTHWSTTVLVWLSRKVTEGSCHWSTRVWDALYGSPVKKGEVCLEFNNSQDKTTVKNNETTVRPLTTTPHRHRKRYQGFCHWRRTTFSVSYCVPDSWTCDVSVTRLDLCRLLYFCDLVITVYMANTFFYRNRNHCMWLPKSSVLEWEVIESFTTRARGHTLFPPCLLFRLSRSGEAFPQGVSEVCVFESLNLGQYKWTPPSI